MAGIVSFAAVSAVLRHLLIDGLGDVSPYVGTAAVTAITPDMIPIDAAGGSRLNLFLHRVTRNRGRADVPGSPPSSSASNSSNLFGPLFVDLHYVLTAYGHEELNAEVLLGEAMLIMHEHQRIGRETIRTILTYPEGLPPALGNTTAQSNIYAEALADQSEGLTVTLEPFNTEEMSQLWSMLQGRYRPSVCYLVTTVVLEHRRPRPIPRVVLSRGPLDAEGNEQGPAVALGVGSESPRISSVEHAENEISAVLGDTILVHGSGLAGSGAKALLSHPGAPSTLSLPLPEIAAPGDEARVTLDPMAGVWRPGTYTLRLSVPQSASPGWRNTNAVEFQLAPAAKWHEATVADSTYSDADGEQHRRSSVAVAISPAPATNQEVVLYLGARGVAVPAPTPVQGSSPEEATLNAEFIDFEDGSYPARVAVDGVESHLFDRSLKPMSMDPESVVKIQ